MDNYKVFLNIITLLDSFKFILLNSTCYKGRAMYFYNNFKIFRTLFFVLTVFNLHFTPTSSVASESDFFKGVMGAIIVNGILQEVKKNKDPVINRKQVTYLNPYNSSLHAHATNKAQQKNNQTIPQKAFTSQLPTVRYSIQEELMKMGYYYGKLDGHWGLKTEHAISSYARDTKQLHLLTSLRSTNSLFNKILNSQTIVNYKLNQLSHKDEIMGLETRISRLLEEIRRLEIRISQLKVN